MVTEMVRVACSSFVHMNATDRFTVCIVSVAKLMESAAGFAGGHEVKHKSRFAIALDTFRSPLISELQRVRRDFALAFVNAHLITFCVYFRPNLKLKYARMCARKSL